MPEHVLIVGASGLVGSAAANSFLNSGWQVTTTSRRAPEWVDSSAGRHQHVALDLTDADACRGFTEQCGDITHVVYAAVFELPGLIAGWSDPVQIATNARMIKNLLVPMAAHGKLQHVTLLQGTKAYGAAVQPMRIPARESQPRVQHANFYWEQEDFLTELAQQHEFAYTILRPQLIVGPNYGVVMNLPPVIGAYAALRKAEGQPFSYPGNADWVWEAADVRLVGDACVWSASSTQAANQTFNITNGEVFSWLDMWPALADCLDVQAGPPEAVDLPSYFEARTELWQEIVHAQNLRSPNLAAFLGESQHYANLCFAVGAPQAPAPTYVSTIKIKQAGFHQVMDTEQSFCHWLRELRRARYLP